MRWFAPWSLILLLLGCGLEPTEPAPTAYLPEDDDDSASTNDDDDAGPAPRHVEGVLVEIRETGGERWAGALSFHPDDGEEFATFGLEDLTPLPGVQLSETPPSIPECTVLSSDTSPPRLPPSDPVGGEVTWSSSVGGDRTLLEDRGVYAGAGNDDASEPAPSWDVDVKGGADWPSGGLNADLQSPPFLDGILPGEGTLGSLDEVHFSWTSPPDPGGVELLLWRSTTGDEWTAVRCVGEDVGELRVRADNLAAATGPIHVWASHADWTNREGSSNEARLDLGVVRTVHYEMRLAR